MAYTKGGKSRKNEATGKEVNITLETIQDIFTNMFKKHEEAITQILTANTKIVNEEIQKLTNKIVDFQESLEFTQKELSDKIKKVEHHVDEVKRHVDDDIEWMTWKIRNLEDRSRRNNLRIDGLPESLNESWKITEEKVQHLFNETLNLTNVNIERAHRTANKTKKQKESNLPRTVVLKLLSYKDKVDIMENVNKLKGSGIYVNEDFSKETLEIRRELWKDVKRLRDEGKYAVLQYDKIVTHDFKK